MFDFFKSKDTLIKEAEVHKVGEELFKQIASARDNKILNDQNFNERINSMFSAGYISGFIVTKLSHLFDNNKLIRKYLEKILAGALSISGIKLFDSKLEAYKLGKSIVENKNSKLKPEHFNEVLLGITHYELGFNAGKSEIFAWEANADYIPHLLLDYLITGEVGQL